MAKCICRTCGGTGAILSHRSWFPADGFSRDKCGICGGTGQSSYRDDPEYIAFQKTARAARKHAAPAQAA